MLVLKGKYNSSCPIPIKLEVKHFQLHKYNKKVYKQRFKRGKKEVIATI